MTFRNRRERGAAALGATTTSHIDRQGTHLAGQSKRKTKPESDAPAVEPRWPYVAEYWRQSQRPLVSLAFILPLLALYEGGVVWLGPAAMRNGADVWLRRLLDQFGFGQYFLLPALTVSLLLAWHHTTQERWRVSRDVLVGMYVESSLLAVVLLGIGLAQRSLSHLAHSQLTLSQSALPGSFPALVESDALRPALTAVAGRDAWPWAARLVAFCGAGIYEEVLFRLILVPVVGALVALLALERQWCVAAAVVVTSVAFSAAHYVGAQGEAFDWFSFSFRFLAGVFFALLFVRRGFGIAAGTHALYDIFVGVV
jgi:membrane protease YdiL (CAAX protease family)